jgi:hypothetical protein
MFSGIWDIFCVIYGHSVRGGMRFDAEARRRGGKRGENQRQKELGGSGEEGGRGVRNSYKGACVLVDGLGGRGRLWYIQHKSELFEPVLVGERGF